MEEENGKKNEGEDQKKVYEEDLKNIKSEFDRKLGNLVNSQEQLIQMMGEMKQNNKQSEGNTQSSDDFDDLFLTDPKKAMNMIKADIRKEIKGEIDSEAQQTNKQAQILNELVLEYPELSQQDHNLTKKTIEIYSKMSDADKNNPISYKAAVHEAAVKLGVPPKSMRNVDTDNFSLSGQGSVINKNKSKKLDNRTVAFAQMLGLDTDNKKVLDRLEERSKRNYKNWE